ncbi:hypothetical protein [Formosa agariphila]|uniref:hypothetical protein n=1 Tax=Formosa agariphila TaxID=320324 RepID=UPI00057003AC|nr:hypothetical protein [Formosa agariphila]
MIIINNKKKRPNRNLIMAIIWALFVIAKLLFSETNSLDLLDYGWLFLSVLYFTLYYFERFKPYITIDNDVICQYTPFPKRIAFKDIIKIKHSGGIYTIDSPSKKMTIDLELITESDFSKLKSVIEELHPQTNLA